MPARIVCLVPSITELVCDLGLADQLVGRTPPSRYLVRFADAA
jgi:ABC-type hemin transport system substrate-binding protein